MTECPKCGRTHAALDPAATPIGCDDCARLATFLAFAAYDADDVDGLGAHPGLRRYPMPMIRACPEHLVARLERDVAAPGSTSQWVVRHLCASAQEHVESYTCPKCGRTSHHPDDVREGYCGACHDWTRDARPDLDVGRGPGARP